MKGTVITAVLGAVGLWAQSAETVYFHARMLPTNEVPATDFAGTGSSTIIAHVVRDASGEVVSGSVEFNVSLALTGQADLNITGLHIHRGAAGENGPVVIDSGIARGPITVPVISQVGNVLAGNASAVAALRDLLQNPGAFYVNIHTAVFPGGAVRGQVERATVAVYGGLMTPDQENPPVPVSARGAAAVVAVYSQNSSGAITHGSVQFASAYTFTQAVTLTGYHIHRGDSGVNGPVVINSLVPSQMPSPPEGLVGVLLPGGFAEMITPDQINTLTGLVNNPTGHYVNIHNTDYPGGVIRGQLSLAEVIRIPFVATPGEEFPVITGLDAQAVGTVGIIAQRHEDGSAKAGAVFFDANHRFPGETTFTGMHVHCAARGVNGSVVFSSGAPAQLPSPTGFGNIYLLGAPVYKPEQLDILNELLRSPENFYFNLHTSVNPGGAVRAQLARPAGTPLISRVSSANLVTDNVAPGGLFTVLGENLAKLRGTLEGWSGTRLPDLVNGAALTLGGIRAGIVYVSGDQINAQAAFETPVGMQQVVVGNGSANGVRDGVRVAASAPAIFVAGSQPYVVKASDGSLVTAANQAAAGDMLWVYYTGGGATTPALQTGQIVPAAGTYSTAAATATIGGVNAEVRSSIANPGLAGVYRASVIVPGGVQPGARALVLSLAGNASNAVEVALR